MKLTGIGNFSEEDKSSSLIRDAELYALRNQSVPGGGWGLGHFSCEYCSLPVLFYAKYDPGFELGTMNFVSEPKDPIGQKMVCLQLRQPCEIFFDGVKDLCSGVFEVK
jgi:hypothetical protein